MRTAPRRWARALLLLAIVLALASFSAPRGRTLTITDMQGAPISGAYVLSHYEGRAFGLADSVTYQATQLSILESDADGHAAIPGIVRFHWPFVQAAPELAVDLVYAPSLHNGLAWVNRRIAVSRPQEFDVSADLATVRLADVSADPVRWEGTLGNLESVLGGLTSRQMRGEPIPPLTDDLTRQFTREYGAMLDRYGDTLRETPPMPDALRAGTEQDRHDWQAMIDRDLAARPRWKDELERAFGTQIRIFNRR